MRIERIIADVACLVLAVIVVWDVLVVTNIITGETITDEIKHSWRSWAFFFLVGIIAGGHFLAQNPPKP